MRNRRPPGLASCEVPGCARSVGKEPGFCARCWGMMTDGEQAMLRFSRHAPFWRRYLPHDGDEDLVPCHDPTAKPPGSPVGVLAVDGYLYTDEQLNTGGRTSYHNSLGMRLREFEARTTQQAIARNVGDRIWLGGRS